MIPSMVAIVLTDEEWDALRAHRENAPHKLMRRMAEAILMLSRGRAGGSWRISSGAPSGRLAGGSGDGGGAAWIPFAPGTPGTGTSACSPGSRRRRCWRPCPVRPRSRDWMRSSGAFPTWPGGFMVVFRREAGVGRLLPLSAAHGGVVLPPARERGPAPRPRGGDRGPHGADPRRDRRDHGEGAGRGGRRRTGAGGRPGRGRTARRGPARMS